jgi:hypothetical protein
MSKSIIDWLNFNALTESRGKHAARWWIPDRDPGDYVGRHRHGPGMHPVEWLQMEHTVISVDDYMEIMRGVSPGMVCDNSLYYHMKDKK